MSRVGKNPIVLPAGVEITFGEQITVKGPLGTLQIAANDAVEVKKEGQEIVVSKVEGAVNASAMWGTMRAKAAGVEQVAFDRSGLQYHGRVKALAEAAREAGLKF